MQRCVVLMRSARRFFTAAGTNLVCVYTGTAFQNSSQAREVRLSAPSHSQAPRGCVGSVMKTIQPRQSDKLEGLVDGFPAHISTLRARLQRHSALVVDCALQQLTFIRDAGRTWLKS